MGPSAEHKAWAGILRARAGESARVHYHHDEAEERSIAIFSGQVRDDWIGATIGLMDINQSRKKGVEINTEVVMERRGSNELVGNILSTIAFFSMKNGWQICPDMVFKSMVSMYMPETRLPHVMFVPIFRWNDLSTVRVESKTIYPLLGIPISQSELDLHVAQGPEALLSKLEAASADVNDWQRLPVT